MDNRDQQVRESKRYNPTLHTYDVPIFPAMQL